MRQNPGSQAATGAADSPPERDPSRRGLRTVFRVFAYLRRYPVLGGLQLFCAILMTALMLVFPQATRTVIGEIIPEGDLRKLGWAIAFVVAAFAGTNLFNALRIVLNNTFEQKVIFDIRSDLYRRIQRLPMTWFNQKRTGDVMTRVTEDVTAMERVLIDGIEQGVVAVLQILGFGIWLFFQNPALAGVAMLPIPFLVAGAVAYTASAPDRYRTVRRATSAMNALLHDNIDGIQQIKSFTREQAEHDRFNRASDTVRRATLRVMRVWAAYNPSMEFFRNLGYALVLGFGGYWAVTGRFGLSVSEEGFGILGGFLVALSLFYEPISRLHGLNQIIQQGRAAAERVFEIIDAEEERNVDEGAELAEPVRGHVVFDRVSFSYTGQMATLADLSLEARPGETIALVGHTGAGKSTVINLLTRFFEYDEGTVTIDGRPIHQLSKASLRKAVGYVTQESFLFNGSVRDNLLLADPDAEEDALWHALEVANAREFVERLPEQLETNVGERGVKLSVGEKQRIAIARVILKNPPILLLDEATASVDTETEDLIQAALERLMADRTAFVVAHRLSTVRNADRIYVLDAGRIVEQGTHDELIEHDGRYADLCRRSLIADARAAGLPG